jgi:hypothetical protein
LPIVPIYGGFPVKLRTHIGKPIPYDPNLSAEDLQKKVTLVKKNIFINIFKDIYILFYGLLGDIFIVIYFLF